jgi:hypothetical protein
VLFVVAYRNGLLRREIPRASFRYGVTASTAPVLVFLLSLPIAFWISPTWALLSWLLAIPLQLAIGRTAPAGARDEIVPGGRPADDDASDGD